MISAFVNPIIKNQNGMKLVLAYQRISSFYTRKLLQCQDEQDKGITTSSILTFDAPLEKPPPKDADILETKLLRAKSSDEVLQLAATHSTIMTNKHISAAFSLYHGFLKVRPIKELSEATCNPGFQNLCKRVMKTAHHLAPEEAITVFKTLSFLNVSITANIMQVLCQVIRRNINSLPLNQIVFLMFLLKKQQRTPLVEALTMALPLVLQSQIDLQMDPENVNEMVHCLEVATTRKLSDAVVQKLSDAILQKADTLTAYQARVIVASLIPEHQFPDSFEQLVFKSLDILAQDINNITDKEAMMLLQKLHRTKFFNRSFLLSLIDVAMKRNWDLVKLNRLLNICEAFEFISEDLLHYTICKMQLQTTELCNNNKISLTNITGPFGLVGYESAPSNEVWTVVRNCKEKLEELLKKSPFLFLKLNSELSILGSQPHPAVFTDAVLSSVSRNIKKGRTRLARELCIIEWTTKIMNADFPGPHLPENIVHEAINSIWEERQKSKFFLAPFLKIGLGGDQFFETNIMTKYGHAIDYVILLRKGDYPIAIERTEESVNKESPATIKFIEDFSAPPEAKILTIIEADSSFFCKNSSHLKGWVKIKLNTLSKLGYLPLLIKYETWDGLLSHEKIPYLMREIKEVLKQSEQEDAINAYPIV